MGAPPEGILCMYGLHIKSSTGDVDKHRKQIRNFSLCDVIAAVRRRKFARYCKTVKVRNSHNVACMLLLRSEKKETEAFCKRLKREYRVKMCVHLQLIQTSPARISSCSLEVSKLGLKFSMHLVFKQNKYRSPKSAAAGAFILARRVCTTRIFFFFFTLNSHGRMPYDF